MPIEVIERIAAKYLPERNRLDGDGLWKTPHELAYFGVDSEQKLDALLAEQIHSVLQEDAVLAEEAREPQLAQRESESYKSYSPEMQAIIDHGIERVLNGAFMSWSGLISMALSGRFGKQATDEYVDKHLFPRPPSRTNSRRSG